MSTVGDSNRPTLIAFLADLMVTTRVELGAAEAGFTPIFIAGESDLGQSGKEPVETRPGEPVLGADWNLINLVTRHQPSLLIFDLSHAAVPWQRWLPLLKSSPATRRIPILCFGPHIDGVAMNLAVELGADAVTPRSRFMSAMPRLFQEYGRAIDQGAIQRSCLEPLDEEAIVGLSEFNRGNYFLAHEHLENAWNLDTGAAREVYKAVLQVAVAYLQIQRGNYAGAVKMFLRARQWLGIMPEHCRGIDIGRLRADAEAIYGRLVATGPEGVDAFGAEKFPPVRYRSS